MANHWLNEIEKESVCILKLASQIYFIKLDNHIKIGITQNLDARLDSLRNGNGELSPNEIKVVGTINKTELDKEIGIVDELKLYEMFSEYSVGWGWYDLPDNWTDKVAEAGYKINTLAENFLSKLNG